MNMELRVCALLLCMGLVRACRLHGTESGICVDPDPNVWRDEMPFCGFEDSEDSFPVVRYRACLPLKSDMSNMHTVREKDKWVKEFFDRIVAERIRHETNGTLEDRGVNEFLEGGEIIPRMQGYSTSDDCVNAFKNYMCFMNFPRCDDEDHTLLMCRSACENLHKACQYEKDLWRCGEPEYLYGYSGESSSEMVGEEEGDKKKVYWRYPYPGAPFRDNLFRDGEPLPACTPSLIDAAPGLGPARWGAALSAALAVALLLPR